MMRASFVLILLLLQAIDIDAVLTCLTKCTIAGSKGQPLNISSGHCSEDHTADACLAVISFEYHLGRYRVMFSTSFVTHYARLIHAIPSNYLMHITGYACSENEQCAFEFARRHVLDLSERAYNSSELSAELAPIIQEPTLGFATLTCLNNETCTGGVCQIGYDTRLNIQTEGGCEKDYNLAGVTVYDSSSNRSILVECDRTRCNSPGTLDKVKMILAKHNLTDSHGRIPADDIGKYINATAGKLNVTDANGSISVNNTTRQTTTRRNPNHGHCLMVPIVLLCGLAILSILVYVPSI